MKKLLLFSCLIAATFVSCSKDDSQLNEMKTKKQSTQRFEASQDSVKNDDADYFGILESVKGAVQNGVPYTCETCRCRTVGYHHFEGFPAGVGAYHVVCSSGREYEVIAMSINDMTVYPGGTVFQVPKNHWWNKPNDELSNKGVEITIDNPEYQDISNAAKGAVESGMLETGTPYNCETCRCRTDRVYVTPELMSVVFCHVTCSSGRKYLAQYNLIWKEVTHIEEVAY